MQVAVVATVCFAVTGSAPVCRDEIALEVDSIGIGCLIGEAEVDAWKDRSIYRGEQWTVRRVRCVPGGYAPREPA